VSSGAGLELGSESARKIAQRASYWLGEGGAESGVRWSAGALARGALGLASDRKVA
jgi:hypothetical protein